MDLGSGQAGINSISMAAQSNGGVVVFSAMYADLVVLRNGQNSKTVCRRQRQSEIKGKVKIPQKRKRFSKKVQVKWAWLFSQKKKKMMMTPSTSTNFMPASLNLLLSLFCLNCYSTDKHSL